MLSVTNLICQRNNHDLFAAITFSLSAGQLLWIKGDNGVGKTSLLNIIAGLVRPKLGEILWQGAPIYNDLPNYYQNLIYLGHSLGIKKNLTVQENIELMAKMMIAAVDKDALQQVLAYLDLWQIKDKTTTQLSAGQLRRLSLARLLLKPAKLWILDEPFNTLDQRGVNLIESLIERHCALDGSVLISSHQPFAARVDEVVELGDYVY